MSQTPMPHKSLGRGLDALLGPASSSSDQDNDQAIHRVMIHECSPGKYQPRDHFDQESLESLMASIQEKGVIQPILVRPIHQGLENYEIVAGERRWRAAKEAGLSEIPVIIREMTDLQALETGLIENIQRQDLSALEEAQGFKRLMDEFRYTQEDLARALGKSRSYIANSVRLLSLDENSKSALKEGKITAGHARALLGVENPDDLLQKIIRNGLNVRQTEKLVQQSQKKGAPEPSRTPFVSDAQEDVLKLSENLTHRLGVPARLEFKTASSGLLHLSFYSLEQLDGIISKICPPKTEDPV